MAQLMIEIPWASVVIPTYGPKGVELTRKCVESLMRTHAHQVPETIVVSDGDAEPEMEALKAMAQEFSFGLARIERRGFAAACNIGLRLANGGIAVFLVNNDIEFIDGQPCLQVMADVLLSTHSGIVGCRLLYPDMTIQHAGVIYVPAPKDSPVPGYFDHVLRYQPALHHDAVAMRASLVTGALMGISRAFIETSGYLDERFSFSAEDIDLCLRGIETGLPPVYCGYTAAIHHEGATRGRTLEEKMTLAPEIAQREVESLAFLHLKWTGVNFGKLFGGSL